MIDSELAITKLPTNSATPANASRNVFRNERKLLVDEASLVASCAPVRTWASRGSTVRICATSCCGLTPGLALTRMSSSFPTLPNRRCAVGRAKPARVAPPSEAEEPNWTRPEIRIATTGPFACTPIRSPARRLFLAAVMVSTTTPDGPGQWPLTSFSELNSGFDGSTLKPRFGAPPNAIA